MNGHIPFRYALNTMSDWPSRHKSDLCSPAVQSVAYSTYSMCYLGSEWESNPNYPVQNLINTLSYPGPYRIQKANRPERKQ